MENIKEVYYKDHFMLCNFENGAVVLVDEDSKTAVKEYLKVHLHLLILSASLPLKNSGSLEYQFMPRELAVRAATLYPQEGMIL